MSYNVAVETIVICTHGNSSPAIFHSVLPFSHPVDASCYARDLVKVEQLDPCTTIYRKATKLF